MSINTNEFNFDNEFSISSVISEYQEDSNIKKLDDNDLEVIFGESHIEINTDIIENTYKENSFPIPNIGNLEFMKLLSHMSKKPLKSFIISYDKNHSDQIDYSSFSETELEEVRELLGETPNETKMKSLSFDVNDTNTDDFVDTDDDSLDFDVFDNDATNTSSATNKNNIVGEKIRELFADGTVKGGEDLSSYNTDTDTITNIVTYIDETTGDYIIDLSGVDDLSKININHLILNNAFKNNIIPENIVIKYQGQEFRYNMEVNPLSTQATPNNTQPKEVEESEDQIKGEDEELVSDELEELTEDEEVVSDEQFQELTEVEELAEDTSFEEEQIQELVDEDINHNEENTQDFTTNLNIEELDEDTDELDEELEDIKDLSFDEDTEQETSEETVEEIQELDFIETEDKEDLSEDIDKVMNNIVANTKKNLENKEFEGNIDDSYENINNFKDQYYADESDIYKL